MIVRMTDLDIQDIKVIRLNTIRSKPFYDKSRWYESVVKKLLLEYGSKNEVAIRWWVTNIVRITHRKGKYLSVKLDNNYYVRNKCKITAKKVSTFIHLLEKDGYVNIYKGYKRTNRYGEVDAQATIVEFLDKTFDLLTVIKYPQLFKSSMLDDVIVVKDRETGEHKDLRNFPNIKEVRGQVEKYNEYLGSKSIKFNNREVATVEYKRSYTDNSEQGGRFYVNGGGVQLLPQKLRSEFLTIDDEPVVELDYSSNHPNMLYEIRNTAGNLDYDLREFLGEEFKPYACDTRFIDISQEALEKHKELVGDSYDPVRNLCKISLLVMLNSRDRQTAKMSVNFELNKDKRRKQEDKKFVGLGKVSVETLLTNMTDHNFLIEDYFFCDMGLKLQNTDSKIALDVIDRMMQDEIPVLCWHDSFVTPVSGEVQLERAMKEAWKFVLEDNKFCYVDKK